MSDEVKQVTVRLPLEEYEKLEAVSVVDGATLTELVVEAIGLLVESRQDDPAWQERREAALERHRRLLDSVS